MADSVEELSTAVQEEEEKLRKLRNLRDQAKKIEEEADRVRGEHNSSNDVLYF